MTSASYPKWFCWLSIDHFLPEFRGIAADKATTMGHIQRHHLTESLCAVPSALLLTRMDALMAPIFEQIVQLRRQARSLARTRDALLPKLLSGQARVGEEAGYAFAEAAL